MYRYGVSLYLCTLCSFVSSRTDEMSVMYRYGVSLYLCTLCSFVSSRTDEMSVMYRYALIDRRVVHELFVFLR